MKYIITSYIALGLILSLVIGVEYNCVGREMFPTYYGNPFVFKEKSLGSSMKYFYSISGLVLNVVIWSIFVLIVRLVVLRLIEKTGNRKAVEIIYKGVTRLMIVFTTINVAIDWLILEHSFTYRYIDLDKEAEDWGVKCEGELMLIIK